MAEAIKNRPLPDEKIGGDDANLLRIARERYQKAIDADRENRDAALEDLRFMAGDQWPEELRRERKEDGRPFLTINRMPQFVRQVTNDIRQNKPAIKVRPADDKADDEIADVYSGLIRNIEADSDATTAYITAAEGAAQAGIGHFRIVTEYSSDDAFEQDIRIRRIIDPFAVTWDPQAVEPTRSDARYCFVEESLDIETFKARYPKADTSGWDFSDAQSYSYVGDWLTHETVRVAEYWTRTMEPRTLALLLDGSMVDITGIKDRDGIYDLGNGRMEPAVKTRKVWRAKVEMRIINGAEVLEGPFEWSGRYIPIVPVLGEEVHIGRETLRHGVIRHAKDPQRLYNYWRSAQTEYIALQPKSPFIVTADNIKGYENIWKQANTRNLPYLPHIPDKNNAGRAPERATPPMASQGMAQELLIAADDMKATTGIYDAALGAQSNEKSGIAIQRRQAESDISTFAYADNLSRALRHGGRILIDLIPQIYDSERVVRILNEDETVETVEINMTIRNEDGSTKKVNDLALGKYDVIVTTGPSYATKRAEAVDAMLQLVQSVPKVGEVIMDILVKSMDWPGSDEIAKRLRKLLPPGIEEPEEGEEQRPEPPPDPELLVKSKELELKGREQDRKDIETEAKVKKMNVETMREALEVAMADGTLNQIINAQVEAALANMMAQQANGGAALPQ